jgi:microsomal dipeptidase-like Zn-dependent dipeptidase
LCTSTGVVEAGCKVAIATRLKRAGMHWTVRGSDAIIALRCSKLSGRFQDFWERRAEPGDKAAWLFTFLSCTRPDHVGLGSDFDGASMPEGMEDCSKLPRITEALVSKGRTEDEIRKILGGNLLRVMEQSERVSGEKWNPDVERRTSNIRLRDNLPTLKSGLQTGIPICTTGLWGI